MSKAPSGAGVESSLNGIRPPIEPLVRPRPTQGLRRPVQIATRGQVRSREVTGDHVESQIIVQTPFIVSQSTGVLVTRDVGVQITRPINYFDNRNKQNISIGIKFLLEPPSELESNVEIENAAIGRFC